MGFLAVALGILGLGYIDFGATAASGPGGPLTPDRAGGGTILRGFLAGPDVDPTREMVSLMAGPRGFAARLKAIQTTDTLLGEIINLRA